MDDLLGIIQECCAHRYTIERRLGRGGTAIVYLAKDLRHGRSVALKLLDPELALLVGAERFRREIEIAARLTHPHILPLLDSGTITVGSGARLGSDESREPAVGRGGPTVIPYYVMPYIQGESLRERLARAGTLDLEQALLIAREVADALGYAHSEGVVHRDIKPENILLSGGHAVVADFGLARALDEAASDRLTKTGMMLGTPYYMSPEQITGERDVGAPTDIYALGCVLYEMLVGAAPFAGGSMQTVLSRRLAEPAPRLATSGAVAPAFVEVALQRALARDPGARFATAAEFSAALVPPAPGTAGRAVPRLPRSALLFAVPVLLVAAIGLFSLLFRSGSAGSRVTSLAILPLTEATPDPSTAYLREGIPEAVADLLRRLPQLTVAAPSLVSQLVAQQANLDPRELGRRLRVRAFLTGRMRRWGDSLHLRAELVNAGDGRMLWGHTFDGPFADILAIQTQIARAISDSLELTLSGEQTRQLARQPTRDAEAYDLYLRGHYLWVKATPLGASSAGVIGDSVLYYAERVRQRDPNYAGGHYLQAAYHSLAAVRGWRRSVVAQMDSAVAAARRAIEIDSTFAEPLVILGVANVYITDDWAEARRTSRRAVELDPDNAEARRYYGLYLGEVERQLDSAIGHERRAVEIDSSVVYLNSLGDLYLRARRFDSAAIVLRRAVAVDPGLPGPHARLLRAYEEMAQFDSALAVRRRGRDTSGVAEFAAALAGEGPAGYRRVLAQDLRRRIDSIERAMLGPRDEVVETIPPLREGRIAALYARLGDWSKATDWVLREYARRPKRLVTFLANPDFDGLASDPRFTALVRREGLGAFLDRNRGQAGPR
jgi:serine/threonine-protein kinase